MPLTHALLLALGLLSASGQRATIVTPIATSDAVDFARMIARAEGYDVSKTTVYSLELITGSDGKPFVPGYTTMAFEINGNHRNLISINNSTGQAIDYNTCEVFEYPSLKPFQKRMVRINQVKPKTTRELAEDVGCSAPIVLTEPDAHVKHK